MINFLKASNQYLEEKFPNQDIEMELAYLKRGRLTPRLSYKSGGVESTFMVKDGYTELRSTIAEKTMIDYNSGNTDAQLVSQDELPNRISERVLARIGLNEETLNDYDNFVSELKKENPEIVTAILDSAHGQYIFEFKNKDGEILEERFALISDVDEQGISKFIESE